METGEKEEIEKKLDSMKNELKELILDNLKLSETLEIKR